MNNLSKYCGIALSLGFTAALEINANLLNPDPQIRALCTPAQCPAYGKTWVCPPGSGTLDACTVHLRQYSRAILLQTKAPAKAEDAAQLSGRHNQQLKTLWHKIQETYPRAFPLSTGGCTECAACTYPDFPCQKPSERRGSLSAYGIDVGLLCQSAGLEFSFSPETIYMMACILVD